MDQQQAISSPEAISQPTVSTFLSRAADVFSAPGEVYAEVAAAPVQTTSWLLPWLFSLIMGIVFTFALYNNALLRQQIYDMQSDGMKASVAQGKMTQEQFDRATEAMESSGPALFMMIGGGGAVVSLSAIFFGASLAFWLVAKFALGFAGSYSKALEVFGLASLIGLLGSIVTLLMMNVFNSFYAQPAPSLLVMDTFDHSNKLHRLFSSLNVFTIWQVAVLGIGIGKISRKTAGAGIGIAFALWGLWVIVSVSFGWGMR